MAEKGPPGAPGYEEGGAGIQSHSTDLMDLSLENTVNWFLIKQQLLGKRLAIFNRLSSRLIKPAA